jgi:hypothetical protein
MIHNNAKELYMRDRKRGNLPWGEQENPEL